MTYKTSSDGVNLRVLTESVKINFGFGELKGPRECKTRWCS